MNAKLLEKPVVLYLLDLPDHEACVRKMCVLDYSIVDRELKTPCCFQQWPNQATTLLLFDLVFASTGLLFVSIEFGGAARTMFFSHSDKMTHMSIDRVCRDLMRCSDLNNSTLVKNRYAIAQ